MSEVVTEGAFLSKSLVISTIYPIQGRLPVGKLSTSSKMTGLNAGGK
jgi:hypothetical protein